LYSGKRWFTPDTDLLYLFCYEDIRADVTATRHVYFRIAKIYLAGIHIYRRIQKPM
jgi:hypothetical protein